MTKSNFFQGFKKGMSAFGTDITNLVNSVLLLVVYIIGVGISSIPAKIIGKKFINTEIPKNKSSYWRNLNLKRKPTDEYYRQF